MLCWPPRNMFDTPRSEDGFRVDHGASTNHCPTNRVRRKSRLITASDESSFRWQLLLHPSRTAQLPEKQSDCAASQCAQISVVYACTRRAGARVEVDSPPTRSSSSSQWRLSTLTGPPESTEGRTRRWYTLDLALQAGVAGPDAALADRPADHLVLHIVSAPELGICCHRLYSDVKRTLCRRGLSGVRCQRPQHVSTFPLDPTLDRFVLQITSFSVHNTLPGPLLGYECLCKATSEIVHYRSLAKTRCRLPTKISVPEICLAQRDVWLSSSAVGPVAARCSGCAAVAKRLSSCLPYL